ncbi:adenylate/guanylate cyclase domain-containing protein [Segnochrobactrum spirostomi]|uniref:Adenylate/guanylate cyclase domain-containing protein n=1 Tax=Segnochrobactrum spirostomi TaxID=2608987 RepID=A0A6A7XXN8_9HYPH|nr:adenylate/guanylate cyclase domain-containing protein [Segnochrobactrum spirostomi]MQT11440.1 adenylate/guanylate cyclase domain-containing protein [Segnochrobactrum spirostomi]
MDTLLSVLDPSLRPHAEALRAWFLSAECHALDLEGLVTAAGEHFGALGLNIDRLGFHSRALHPAISAHGVSWLSGLGLHRFERGYDPVLPELLADPILHRVILDNRPFRGRISVESDTPFQRHMTEFGIRDLYMVPLFGNGEIVTAVAWGSRTGLGEQAVAFCDAVMSALRAAVEVRVLRDIGVTLMATYVGSRAGGLVLAGNIRRGTSTKMEAAIIFCDLRGFTALSNAIPADEVMGLLDGYFDRVVPAIEGQGGEILKFMGDGVLGVFHDPSRTPAQNCGAALRAAQGVLATLQAEISGRRLETSIALHWGTVLYGNIGAGNRLDFTVIGPAVNLTSRIEGECSPRGESVLVSDAFAARVPDARFRSIGRVALRGFAEPVELFAPLFEGTDA